MSRTTPFLSPPPSPANEGRLREKLAAFFLAVPAPDRQTPREREDYRRAAAALSELELCAALQSAGLSRTLRYGDLCSLLRSTLEAAAQRLRDNGTKVDLNCSDDPVCLSAEPRLAQLATLRLLKAAAATGGPVHAALRKRGNGIHLSVSSPRPFADQRLLALARETARLHGGRALVAGSAVALSFHRDAGPAAGLFAAPDAADLLRGPLSPVNIELPR